MIVFPNCKINLGLHITGKRADGYHNLETIFYPVPFCDALEIVAEYQAPDAPPPATEHIRFASSGLSIPSEPAQNLCIKAYQLLRQNFPELPPIQMHLHKIIPMGAGLGGGSSNGAFVLSLLNQLFELGISQSNLVQYALQLGSDCPFFIVNKPCFASGRGEILEPIDFSLKGYFLLLVNPGIHISTKAAFESMVPKPMKTSLKSIISLPIEQWKNEMVNDFEAGIFMLHPEIQRIKEALYNSGAVYASMTGSGSTVFGIFQSASTHLFSFEKDYFVKQIELQ